MASPQKENGYTPIANEIMEALAVSMPGQTEGGVLISLLRKTYGWNKKADKISISQLCELTGHSKRAVIYALQNLEAKKMVIIKRSTAAGNKQPNEITFNKHYNEWVVQNSAPQVIKNRERAKLTSAKLRTSAKLCTRVVQNSVKKCKNFAHTKDTYTKETIINNRKQASEYGNEDINKVLSFLKSRIGIQDFTNSQRWQRIYAKHCLNLMKKITAKEFGRRLEILLEDKFQGQRMNNIKVLYEQVKGFKEPTNITPSF